MSGHILIVDSVATNRIVLKVKLDAAQYRADACASIADAQRAIAAELPDLILVEFSPPTDQARAFCVALRAAPATATVPIVATGHFDTTADRMAALTAGVDDILVKPIADNLLQARIRSLLRARDADSELRLREDTRKALGFAEAGVDFIKGGTITVVSDQATADPLNLSLAKASGLRVAVLGPDAALDRPVAGPVPDVFVIRAAMPGVRPDMARVFRLIADLRSRSETRHAAQLVIAPTATPEVAAMALDLGANDVVSEDASIAEIALRTKVLLRRKANLDRLRDTVQSGLQAAVTDPLTGLYNRRYAMPHLAGMAERARATGRDFALMVLDIDHFKAINDGFGHAVGDRVLVGVAQRLRDNLRAVDLIARIGGEEFLVAMPDTTIAQARGAAERLCGLIQGAPFVSGGLAPPVKVTLSIGVAMGDVAGKDATDVMDIMARADAALYAAKSAGRNMVTMSQSAA